MLPSKHVLYGLFFSAIALLLYTDMGLFGFFIMFLASVFIDVDHYLAYVYIKKDISLSRAYDFYAIATYDILSKKTAKKEPLMIFHTIESFIVLILLSFFSSFFLYVLMGFVVHSAADVFFMHHHEILFVRNFSIINYFLKRKKKK